MRPESSGFDREVGAQTVLSILNVILVINMTVKILYLIRFYQSLGQLVQLVYQCLLDVLHFTLFYGFFVLTITILFYVTGVSFDDSEYSTLLGFMISFLEVFRSSIGDVRAPLYDFWVDNYGSYPTSSTWVITIIWLIWFANAFFVFIILLNFLIAIISQSFEEVMSKSLNFQYKHSAELNRECQLIRNAFNLRTNYDIFLLTTASFKQDQNQEWSGFVNAIRRYVKMQNLVNFSKVNN